MSHVYLPIQTSPNTTDILHAEVDYNINEVENIMICKGNLIEIESGEFSAKYGLISRCLFLSKLLEQANLSDSKLEQDPFFNANESKCIIRFMCTQDAEEFINCHNTKYRIILKNLKTDEKDDNKNSSSKNSNHKLVSFNFDSSNSDIKPLSTKSTLGLNLNESTTLSNETKKNHQEGYETLTIRAKLKQKVGSNRTKHVTLRDIDSIMRNVVTVVQNEFMKQFPSATTVQHQQQQISNGDE